MPAFKPLEKNCGFNADALFPILEYIIFSACVVGFPKTILDLLPTFQIGNASRQNSKYNLVNAPELLLNFRKV